MCFVLRHQQHDAVQAPLTDLNLKGLTELRSVASRVSISALLAFSILAIAPGGAEAANTRADGERDGSQACARGIYKGLVYPKTPPNSPDYFDGWVAGCTRADAAWRNRSQVPETPSATNPNAGAPIPLPYPSPKTNLERLTNQGFQACASGFRAVTTRNNFRTPPTPEEEALVRGCTARLALQQQGVPGLPDRCRNMLDGCWASNEIAARPMEVEWVYRELSFRGSVAYAYEEGQRRCVKGLPKIPNQFREPNPNDQARLEQAYDQGCAVGTAERQKLAQSQAGQEGSSTAGPPGSPGSPGSRGSAISAPTTRSSGDSGIPQFRADGITSSPSPNSSVAADPKVTATRDVVLTGSFDVSYQAGASACRGGAIPRAYPAVASARDAARGWWDGCNAAHKAVPVRAVTADQAIQLRAHEAQAIAARDVWMVGSTAVAPAGPGINVESRSVAGSTVRADRGADVAPVATRDVERTATTTVTARGGTAVAPVTAGSVSRTDSQSVTPSRPAGADGVRPVQASEPSTVAAGGVRPRPADAIAAAGSSAVHRVEAQSVRPAEAAGVRPVQSAEVVAVAPADSVQPRKTETGDCVPAPPRNTRFIGTLREATGSYKITVEFSDIPRNGQVNANVTIVGADNRVLDGKLPGMLRDGAFELSGVLASWPNRWEHRLSGTLAGATLRARATTRGVGNREWTQGEVSANAPAGVDPGVIGSWAMVVPGSAYTQEFDRGNHLERVQRASVGAAAGVLDIQPDGRYIWQKNGATERGSLAYCETPAGKRGWSVRFGRESFFAGLLDGANGGFYLFSIRTGDYVYRGQRLR
jgi:hypothetical protein